jgi:O-antigen/teichoic acid export membrane protein
MLLRHTFIYFVGFGASGAIALLATSTYTRLISPAEYGQYAVMQLFFAAVIAGVFEWTRVSLLRSLGHGQAKGSGFFTDFALLYLCGAIAAFSIALVFEHFEYGGGYSLRSPAWLLAAAWAVAHATMDIVLVYARTGMRPIHYVGFQITRALLAFALSVVFVLHGLGAIGLVLGVASTNAVLAAIGLALYKPSGVGFRAGEASATHMRDVAAFGVPVGLAALLGFGAGYADRLLVATFLDPAQVGAYAFTGDFVQRTLVLLNIVVNTATYPYTARIFEAHGKDAARAQMSYNLALLASILLPAGVGLCIAAAPVSQLVAGAAFREEFVWILPWLVLAGLIGGVRYQICDMPLQLVKETRLILWPSGVTLVVGLILGLLLVPRYGVVGALAAANIGQMIGLAASVRITRGTFRFAVPWRELARIVAATVVMAVAYRLLAAEGDLIRSLLAMAAAAGVYAVALVLLDVLGVRQRVVKLARSRGE